MCFERGAEGNLALYGFKALAGSNVVRQFAANVIFECFLGQAGEEVPRQS